LGPAIIEKIKDKSKKIKGRHATDSPSSMVLIIFSKCKTFAYRYSKTMNNNFYQKCSDAQIWYFYIIVFQPFAK
jgi:hypothetical protein